jgi:hypothetical protein
MRRAVLTPASLNSAALTGSGSKSLQHLRFERLPEWHELDFFENVSRKGVCQ